VISQQLVGMALAWNLLVAVLCILVAVSYAQDTAAGDCDDTLSTCIDTMPVLCKFIRDHRMAEHEALAKHRHSLHGFASLSGKVDERYTSLVQPMKKRAGTEAQTRCWQGFRPGEQGQGHLPHPPPDGLRPSRGRRCTVLRHQEEP